uniref:Uncharacterized protein n=1 Tax=Astyanax mexicanus TaxID=7994 RepID=A0A3B1J4B7_ASTMX
VHRDGLFDDQTILHQFADLLLTGVGIGNFIGFIGVQPDLLFATARFTARRVRLRPAATSLRFKRFITVSFSQQGHRRRVKHHTARLSCISVRFVRFYRVLLMFVSASGSSSYLMAAGLREKRPRREESTNIRTCALETHSTAA